MKKLFLFSISAIYLGSCSDSKLPKYVELTDLRVLTLIADKPEANPGETVSITPIVSDVAETTSLSFQAFGCIDPGVALGAEPTCTNNSTKVTLAGSTITSATNSDMAQNFTGTAPSFSASIPNDAVIFNQRSDLDKYNGVGYLIEYTISNTRGQTVNTVKRILVSNKTSGEKNQNPAIAQLQSNGVGLGNNEFPLGGKFTIGMVFNASSFQVYTQKKDDGSSENKSEELTTTWFITDGVLKYFRSTNQETNEYEAPASVPTTRKSFLISISRDSRGGATYKRVCGGC
ncbi:MAG: hypothetical protein B7Y39_19215 [Bdellovibrio sp. 28-41-41]|nr:MAG: hypothetical protein B7Y39_19215 [Bdellovibrio sp. 28-41-41]